MRTIQANDEGFWLLTQNSSIHLINNKLPQGKAGELGFTGLNGVVIGRWEDASLWLVVHKENDGRAYFSLRDQLILPPDKFNLLGRGVTLNHFYHTHQFCGKCGSPTQIMNNEFTVRCMNCGYTHHPVIAPSIIVAIRRGSKILLANHMRHVETKMYTTLAGFVEAGESLEQAVEREVWEETRIKIKNLRYFGSQPWAFPNSQMVGFLADYAEGEIQIQRKEIYDAKWFDANHPLPNLPPVGTIARRLIEATLQDCWQT